MENKLELSFIEVKVIDGIEGLMDEREFNCIMMRLKMEGDMFERFRINGVACHGNKK